MIGPSRTRTLAALCGALLANAAAQTHQASAVIVNAKIYTVNPQQPWAEALAVAGEKILAVGSNREINRYRGAKTRGTLGVFVAAECLHHVHHAFRLFQIRP